MFDRHEAHDNRADAELNRDQPKVLTLRLMTDREVPLPSAAAESMTDMSAVVQKWLDGDVAERVARRADDEAVQFWNRITTETRRRSRMETPVHMSDRIMAVLPKKSPSKMDLLFRTFGMKPVTAVLCAAVLLAAGVAAGEWLLH